MAGDNILICLAKRKPKENVIFCPLSFLPLNGIRIFSVRRWRERSTARIESTATLHYGSLFLEGFFTLGVARRTYIKINDDKK